MCMYVDDEKFQDTKLLVKLNERENRGSRGKQSG